MDLQLICSESILCRVSDRKILGYAKTTLYDVIARVSLETPCNLACTYCCRDVKAHELFKIDQSHNFVMKFLRQLRRSLRKKFQPSTKVKPKYGVDFKRLRQSLSTSPKIYNYKLCGVGETFAFPDIIELCLAMTERHYIEVVTNLTLNLVKTFADRVDPSRVLLVTASCHLEELERKKLLGKYVENFNYLKQKGFAVASDVVAHPSLLPKIGYYREYFAKEGIALIFKAFHGVYEGKFYPKSYTPEQMSLFGSPLLQQGLLGAYSIEKEIYLTKGMSCRAGHDVVYISLPSGKVSPCHSLFQSIGNIYDGITLSDQLMVCPKDYCACPFPPPIISS